MIFLQVSAIFIWTYLYILMGLSVDKSTENISTIDTTTNTIHSMGTPENITESLLPSTNSVSSGNLSVQDESSCNRNMRKVETCNFNIQLVFLLIHIYWKFSLVISFHAWSWNCSFNFEKNKNDNYEIELYCISLSNEDNKGFARFLIKQCILWFTSFLHHPLCKRTT